MAQTFYFYDLETSGFNAKKARIMQFAGVRTDLDLNIIGDEINELIKLPKDILPDPEAILLTQITPQKTLEQGYTEAEFLYLFHDKAVKPNTIFVGYNNVRFDDEFLRFLNYRNYYDPYTWAWQDGRSRWDLLDLVRMTRALRPGGIEWPFKDKKANNQLENIAKANKLMHESAHDAMSDVYATIEVAKLIKKNQEKLFSYLLNLRDKKQVKAVVEAGKPFIYTSSHYSSEFLHTTIVYTISASPNGSALVYDLRQDPSQFLAMTVEELAEAWTYKKDRQDKPLPVKTIKYNRVPAIAPVAVINDQETKDRLSLDFEQINKNLATLKKDLADFASKMDQVVAVLDKNRDSTKDSVIATAEEQLYDAFIDRKDEVNLKKTRDSKGNLSLSDIQFADTRLNKMFGLYKARNYPKSLSVEELSAWHNHLKTALLDETNPKLTKFFARINDLKTTRKTKTDQFILEELDLYAQSLLQDLN